MFPAYKHMDPYPQTFPNHENSHHIPYPYHHCPNWEAVPPQMRIDSSKSPSFGPWPYNGSTSLPNPTACHGCCNYSYCPGYYSFRPPYPHIQPPPQCYYYHGSYPLYPDAYIPYFVPPPHYSFDQDRYDYDKAKNHCCGCPNHKYHWGENTGVKIEEQKPESEPKRQESDSCLIKLPNFPYPVARVPHNYLKDKDTNELWNGWIPLDINSLKGLRQGGDDKKVSQNEEKKSLCPWPIMWKPGYDKPEEVVNDLKEISTSPEVSEEMPKVNIIPLKFLENENREKKPGLAENEPTTQAQRESVSEKKMKTKTIPVKQMKEGCENEKQNEKSDEKKSSISVKQKEVNGKEVNGVKKPSDVKQSSTVKLSKLPPVCLRVDPLPRKKNGNGTSRSPSPSGLKERAKIHQDSKEQGSTQKEIKEEISKKEIQVDDAKDKSTNIVEKQEQSSQDVVPIILMKDALQKAVTEKSNEVYEQRTKDGWGGAEASDGRVESKDSDDGIFDEQEKKIEESRGMEVAEIEKMDARKERRNLSESDAAVLIQSAYRGFEVRRWQPLEKLRKIAQIREHVEDIKKQIQSFETSSKGQDTKQKMVMSETIMNLLLQLDTIQGLQQSVREVRKSVARELICLQEKLDSLINHATAEDESSETEESSSSKAFDYQATCPGSSAAAAEASSDQVYEQLSDQNCTMDFTSREKMQRAEAEEKKDTLLVTENQEQESVPRETAELVNKEMISFVNGEHKEAPVQGEEQPVSEAVALEESKLLTEEPSLKLEDSSASSKLLTEEPSLKLEDSSASLASSVKEVLEAPFAANAEATKLDVEEHLETQRPSCQDFESVKKEMCDHGAQPNTQVNLEMEEKGLVQSLEGCELNEATEFKVEKHEAVSNALEFEELLPEKDEPNSENEARIMWSIEDDSKEEDLQMLPLPESDSVEKTAGDAPADTKEVPNTLHVTNAVDFVETIPGVGDSSSEDKARVTHVNEAGTKEEPQMLPVEEGNYFADEASGDPAADTINIEVTCATPVTPGASEEGNDVGSMIEKNLDMQATMVGIMSQDQITVQGGSPESGTENGTNSGAADEVIEHKEMPLAPETHLEATMDKDAPSSVKEIHHKESSPMPIVEAATNEASTAVPEEEIAVAQPKVSIPMAEPVSSMNLSMEEKLVKENEKLREMLEKVLLLGKEHLGVISDLNGRVDDLEKKLAQKKKNMVKVRRHKPAKTSSRKVAC